MFCSLFLNDIFIYHHYKRFNGECMGYWGLHDLLLYNIYVYAKKEHDRDLLEIFSIFRRRLLSKVLLMMFEAKGEAIDVDGVSNEEYIAKIAEEFKTVVNRVGLLFNFEAIKETLNELYRRRSK